MNPICIHSSGKAVPTLYLQKAIPALQKVPRYIGLVPSYVSRKAITPSLVAEHGSFHLQRTRWSPSARITSSRTIIWIWSTFATPFLMRSRILPGVAITTCTAKRGSCQLDLGPRKLSRGEGPEACLGQRSTATPPASLPVSSSRIMSSRRLVPPVVAITLAPPICLLTWIQI